MCMQVQVYAVVINLLALYTMRIFDPHIMLISSSKESIAVPVPNSLAASLPGYVAKPPDLRDSKTRLDRILYRGWTDNKLVGRTRVLIEHMMVIAVGISTHALKGIAATACY